MPAPHPLPARAIALALALLASACGDSAEQGRCRAPRGPVAAADAATDAATTTTGACNGAEALCDRRFDQVVYVTAHNAMSNADEGWYRPNQQHGIARALDDGVRGLMLDVHYYRGEPYLCHSVCMVGRRPLLDAFCELRAFLERNPREVVSLLLETYVAPADLERALAESGLLAYAESHAPGAPWATLRDMIARQRRLVVFAERGGGAPSWYHDLYALSGETRYSYSTPAALDCTPNRGAVSNDLFILNHFLTNLGGSRALADQINHNPLLGERAARCMRETGRLPNFLAVDFYDVGDVFAVARALNGL